MKYRNETKLKNIICVAPVRERGLKSAFALNLAMTRGRSRKGAWIEIVMRTYKNLLRCRRSRKGAWIEITPVRLPMDGPQVAPVRERGLKCFSGGGVALNNRRSLP